MRILVFILYLFFRFFFIVGLFFITSLNPFYLCLNLLLTVVIRCLISGLVLPRIWYSYILFLVFIGGVIVLYIYIVSLNPNKNFYINFRFLGFSFGIFFLFTGVIWYIFSLEGVVIDFNNISLISSSGFGGLYLDSFISIFIYESRKFYLLIVRYLLLTLFIVVDFIIVFKGPLILK